MGIFCGKKIMEIENAEAISCIIAEPGPVEG